MSYETVTPLTPEEIERIRIKPPVRDYPPLSNRLHIPHDEWRAMVAADSIFIPDNPGYHIGNHPNRQRADAGEIEQIATNDNPMPDERIAYWKSSELLTDTAGRPLHPRAAELLPTTGMFTGPGWSYRYGPQQIGNLGLRRVRGGRAEYAVAIGRYGRGLPGGHANVNESPQGAAFREAAEEVGVDMRQPDLLQCLGELGIRDMQARLKCSPRDTLHAWLEERFTFVESFTNPALEGVTLGAGDEEVIGAGWMGVDEIGACELFFGTHRRMIEAYEEIRNE